MLHQVDLSRTIDGESYSRELLRWQLELRQLARRLYTERRSAVLAFEGWDAAGKGGCIRRLTERLDPRGCHVYPIAAPAGDDRNHHWLWRFWRRLLPADEKQVVIFDRTWYGRVLVERVEGFASAAEWRRAYREINDFERQLHDAGIVLVKIFLHISKEEQARRFAAREATPHKRWKLTDEDWRNREQWDAYEAAVVEMLRRTSTLTAPWAVVSAEEKRWARVEVLKTFAHRLQEAVGGKRKEEKKGGSEEARKRGSEEAKELGS